MMAQVMERDRVVERPRETGHTSLVRLTDEEVRRFHDEGFLSVPQISTPDEIERLIAIYDDMFARKVGYPTGDFFDFSGKDDLNPVLPQIVMASQYVPAFMHTLIWQNVEAMAKQLLGPDARYCFDHAMVKPPGGGKPTPWHQDQAFYPAGTRYKSVTFWIPLQAVDRTTGCLKFVPFSNKGPLHEHRSLNNNPRTHGLEALNVDDSRAVYCPLEAGGCTIHHRLTFHGADANVTTTPRRAYAIGYATFDETPLVRREYSWNRSKSTEREKRFRRSLGFSWRRFKQEVRYRLVKLGLV